MISSNPFSESYTQQKSQTDYFPVIFNSEGSKVFGRFFKTANNKLSPTVILLHGFPGEEGDLFGLGKRLNKDGINAFTFNYRGTWKSEGFYLPETSLDDVINSVKFLKSADVAKKYNIDTTQIVLLGYSYGSNLAILGSLAHPLLSKVISIGTSDLSVITKLIASSTDYRKGHQDFLDKYMSDSTIARGLGGKGSHEWLFKHKENYNLVKRAKELANKKILLIGGWKDNLAIVEDHTIPFYRALQNNKAKNIKIEIYDTDHSFGNVREQLYQSVLNWIKN